jgi:hypothetical protein
LASEKRDLRRRTLFNKIGKGKGKQIGAGIDNSLNPQPKTLGKDNPGCLRTPGLFKYFFQSGLSFRGRSHRESTIFDVNLIFLLQEIKAYPRG